MSTATRRASLLAALLLPPLLARAEGADAMGLETLLVAVAAGLGVFSILLTLAAYLLPGQRWLYWAQLPPLLLSFAGGLLLARLPHGGPNWPVAGRLNPLLQVAVPVGIWLNGVLLARRARHDGASRWWLAVAVLGLNAVLSAGLAAGFNAFLGNGLPYATVLQAVYMLLAFALAVISWLLVARQLAAGQLAALWQPWWLLPAVAAALRALHFGFSLYVQLSHESGAVQLPWASVARWVLQSAALHWLAAVVALWLLRSGRPTGPQPTSSE